MSLFISYQIDDKQHRMQLVFDDYFDILTTKYQKECNILWGLVENDLQIDNPSPQIITKAELVSAVLKLLLDIKVAPEFNQYNYFFCLDQLHSKAKGQMAGGFRFHNREGCYAIKAGIGFCTMTKEVLSPDGKSLLFVDPEDLRDVPFIETANWGKVRIIREKKPIAFVRQLKKLLKFLENCSGEMVVKTVQ